MMKRGKLSVYKLWHAFFRSICRNGVRIGRFRHELLFEQSVQRPGYLLLYGLRSRQRDFSLFDLLARFGVERADDHLVRTFGTLRAKTLLGRHLPLRAFVVRRFGPDRIAYMRNQRTGVREKLRAISAR